MLLLLLAVAIFLAGAVRYYRHGTFTPAQAGYCLVALHPERNRDLMRIGALGKLLVLPIVVLAWRRGDASGAGVVASSGDLVLALLFLDVLRRPPLEAPRRAAVTGTRIDR